MNPQALRHHERRGLLPEPARTLGGHRMYPPATIDLLRMIKAAQRLAFTLDEVAELLDIGTRPAGLAGRAAAKPPEVEARIADLTVIRDTLRAAMAAGCADLAVCAATPDCPPPLPRTGT
ncbi:MerR family transcriptional regulator [Actinophytocola sp.]|uniref:MerR family transcriptional regulator n=1 Tax=Actinophytocola sp. TaxID=1872138 RepID=UPI003D6C6299